MAKKFRALVARKPTSWHAAVEEHKQELLAAMPLQELSRARQLSQEQLAEELGATQPEISKIEHRTLGLSALPAAARACRARAGAAAAAQACRPLAALAPRGALGWRRGPGVASRGRLSSAGAGGGSAAGGWRRR